MKDKHMIHLVQEFYTIDAVFQNRDGSLGAKHYTFKVPKDLELSRGDQVVVEARGIFQIAEVAQVHKYAKIDYDSAFTYKWVVQRVDVERYEKIQSFEEAFQQKLEEVLRRRREKQLLETLEQELGVDIKALVHEVNEEMQSHGNM